MSEESTKHFSNIQESTIAAYLGWKQVSGSGARAMHPGDIESEEWLGECKTHTTPNQRLKFDFKVWDKIEEEALSHFKTPALFVDDGSQSIDKTWVLHKPQILEKLSVVQKDLRHQDSYSISDYELNLEYDKSPYMFIVIKHRGSKFAVQKLEDFKAYLELV